MLEGQPLEGVGVSVSPVVKGQGVTAFGKTRADGTYTLTSTRGGTLGETGDSRGQRVRRHLGREGRAAAAEQDQRRARKIR